MLEAAQWRSPLHFRNPHIRITCAVPLKKWRWQSRMGYPVARSLNSRCRSQTCVRLVHPSSFVLWYCLAWLQDLKSDFPKVLTIVEEEVFIWVPEAAKEDATMIGASLSFQTRNLNVNYSLLCSSNEFILFNWANEHSVNMCPTGVHWTETIQCWDKSSWNTACQNAFKSLVFKQSSAKPSGARFAMLCSKIFPESYSLVEPCARRQVAHRSCKLQDPLASCYEAPQGTWTSSSMLSGNMYGSLVIVAAFCSWFHQLVSARPCLQSILRHSSVAYVFYKLSLSHFNCSCFNFF